MLKIADSLQRLDCSLNDLKGMRAGRLRLAVDSSAKYFLPQLLAPFLARYPGVELEFTAGNRILSRLYPDADQDGQLLRKLAAGNTLFQQQDDGSWKDVTKDVGGFSAGWAWGGGFIDIDNDGWEDNFTPNGFISGKSMKDT